jgi:hypothetical protein
LPAIVLCTFLQHGVQEREKLVPLKRGYFHRQVALSASDNFIFSQLPLCIVELLLFAAVALALLASPSAMTHASSSQGLDKTSASTSGRPMWCGNEAEEDAEEGTEEVQEGASEGLERDGCPEAKRFA